MTVHEMAPELEPLVRKIVNKHHKHLKGVDIVTVWRAEAQVTKGRIILGTARIVSGLNALLALPERGESTGLQIPVIEIAKDTWKHLTVEQQAALIDHELCHFDHDREIGKVSIVGHDVEEFSEIVARHGLWKPDLSNFVRSVATHQMALFSGAEIPEPEFPTPEDLKPPKEPTLEQQQAASSVGDLAGARKRRGKQAPLDDVDPTCIPLCQDVDGVTLHHPECPNHPDAEKKSEKD